MTIYVSAGEASGDAYGAALVGEIRRLAADPHSIKVIANGGTQLSAVSDELVADSSEWGAISVIQTLKIVPRVLRSSPTMLRRLRSPDPGGSLAIPIDFGFFNARFARVAKRHGWKVLAFIPPGSWRRTRQAKWAPQIYDAVSTPFSWSAEILEGMGTPGVHWFGHPLKQMLRERITTGGSVERLAQVAVLPGSRKHEVSNNLPLIAAVLPDVPAEFALAPGTDVETFRQRWRELAPHRHDQLTVGDSAGVLLRSRAALVCSGTATLEAALCRCPMTVIYVVTKAMMAEAKLLRIKRPKFIALPNILMDRRIVDELVGPEATAERCRDSFDAVWADGETRTKQLLSFEELDQRLGSDNAITQTAHLALEMLGVRVVSID